MPDRRLLVGEFDSNEPDYGKMFALPPGQASGVPIPAFATGNALPPTGSTIGEGFYDQNTSRGYVWDGAAWREIAASAIAVYANEAAVRADTTAKVGSYGITRDLGELYVKRNTGWVVTGIKEYPSVTALLAATPSVGALGVATDEESLWEASATDWRAISLRELADTAAVLAWTGAGAHTGDRALALDVDVLYVRATNGWRPASIFEDTEANIRASTWAINGQAAISTDTGRTFARVNGVWIEEPINHYATEAALLAATPPDGTLAWSDDTAEVYIRANGAWKKLAGSTNTTGLVLPTNPTVGDIHYDLRDKLEGPLFRTDTGWRRPLPVLGDTANAHKALITNSTGYLTYSQHRYVHRAPFTIDGNSALIPLQGLRVNEFLRIKASGDTDANTRVAFYCQKADGNWLNWNEYFGSGHAHGFAGSTLFDVPAITLKNNYFTGSQIWFTYHSSSYYVASAHLWNAEIRVDVNRHRTHFNSKVHYWSTSGHSAALECSGFLSVGWDDHITAAGLEYISGAKGWFDGYMEFC